jgi:hypothetical protein
MLSAIVSSNAAWGSSLPHREQQLAVVALSGELKWGVLIVCHFVSVLAWPPRQVSRRRGASRSEADRPFSIKSKDWPASFCGI